MDRMPCSRRRSTPLVQPAIRRWHRLAAQHDAFSTALHPPRPTSQPPLATPPRINLVLMEDMVKVAFSQRRKLLRHTLGRWLEARQFSGQFDVQRRAEEVPVSEYVALVQSL